jgi:uncharacterized protein
MEACGVTRVRLHILEVDDPDVREKYTLTVEENVKAFLYFARVEKNFDRMRFDVFDDIRRLLKGDDENMTCVWTGCDPYTTAAVRGVEGSGQRSNCGRTNKDGIDFVKADSEGFERYLALHHTPQEDGGCAGCRYFVMCKGQCPGTALNGDWRNRTEHCLVWKALFEHEEKEMLQMADPELLSDDVRDTIGREFDKRWAAGTGSTIHSILGYLDGIRQKNSPLV